MIMEKEFWKKIYINDDTTRYSISNMGNVRNDTNMCIMKSATDSKGYRRICLTHNGAKYTRKIHRLVMEEFHPVRLTERSVVNHKDMNKSNNRLDNLEWCTVGENNNHAMKNKTFNFRVGVDSHMSKITEHQVHDVCRLLELDVDRNIIHEKTKVPLSTVNKMASGKIWRHIVKGYNIKPKFKMIDPKKLQQVENMIINGESNKFIMSELNIDKVSIIYNVRNRLRREGSTTIL